MAILNCTPDSFSDGGRFSEPGAALRHALEMLDEGAEIVDIGGESTRPGAASVDIDEERRRVLPILTALRAERPEAILSIDTSKPEVAADALAAGADLVNDVTAASAPGMLGLVASRAAGIVLMHMRGDPRTMQKNTVYGDVASEVRGFLEERARCALEAGIPRERVWLDPGIGFGKDVEGNLRLLADLPRLAELDHPLVVGPSRKLFIGRLTGADVDQRLPGTLASLVTTVGLARVVVRVHEPGPVRQFLEVVARIRETAA
jgi:dihydropteroate synthase